MSRLKFVTSLLLMFLCFWSSSLAIRTNGYIINEKSDTIFGIIQLSQLEQTSGAVKINSFEQESLYSRVLFRKKEAIHFEIFYPKDILGFGFTYKTEKFLFKRFEVSHNSLFKNESSRFQFLGLTYKGTIELYRYLNFYDNPHVNRDHIKYETYSDYYLFTPSKGLIKVEPTDKIKTVRDLLRLFDFDEKFLKEVSDNISFKDIKKVLKLYDMWLKAN